MVGFDLVRVLACHVTPLVRFVPVSGGRDLVLLKDRCQEFRNPFKKSNEKMANFLRAAIVGRCDLARFLALSPRDESVWASFLVDALIFGSGCRLQIFFQALFRANRGRKCRVMSIRVIFNVVSHAFGAFPVRVFQDASVEAMSIRGLDRDLGLLVPGVRNVLTHGTSIVCEGDLLMYVIRF